VRRLALAALTFLCVAGPAHAAARPGAAGIGDPYFPKDGNGGYDVQHYGLDIAYTPKTKRLSGTATITAIATQDLSRWNFDFRTLRVRSVTVDGRSAKWRHRGSELTILPRGARRTGRSFVTVVRYAGTPKPVNEGSLGGKDGFMPTDDGALVAGEPHSASTWYPANEHPRDKASYSFRISVPRGVEAIANGNLVGVVARGRRSVWRWEAPEPMASYLSTATIGQFEISTRAVGGRTYVDAIDPDLMGRRGIGERAKAAVAREPEVINFLAGVFGPYPFSAVGSIVDDSPAPFALETQTRPIYTRIFFTDSDDPEMDTVIVHELAHQWAGDHLSVHSWRDIWLNEGFATYAEWLWAEREGRRTAQAAFDLRMHALPGTSRFWDLKVADPGRRHLFDAPVYQRGAMTLHALRVRIGDEPFFRLLKQWVSENAGGTVTTKRFIALAERVSGQQLDGLFDAWLYTPKKPSA
jgi:aminopeptidase N